MAERVLAAESVEVPVDELPVEAVVVGYEHRAARRVVGDPRLELPHDVARVWEGQRLLARYLADRQGFGDELIGDRSKAPGERALQARLDDDRAKPDHRVAARDWAVRFDIHHEER